MVIIVSKDFCITKCYEKSFSDNEIPLEFRTIFSFRKNTEKFLLQPSFEPLTLGLAKLLYHTALKFKILEIRF